VCCSWLIKSDTKTLPIVSQSADDAQSSSMWQSA
jgi:hypothetical protein